MAAGESGCARCDKCDKSTCPRASRPRSQCPSFKLARIPDSEVVDLSGYAAKDADRPYDVYQGGGKAILCLATKAAVLRAIGLRVKAVLGDGFCGYHAVADQLGITTLELLRRLVKFAKADAAKSRPRQQVKLRGPPCQHKESSGCARGCWIGKLEQAISVLQRRAFPLRKGLWFDSLLACWVACMMSRAVICVVAQEGGGNKFTCSMHTAADHSSLLAHTGRASAHRQHRMTAVVHPIDAASAVQSHAPIAIVHNGSDHWESTQPANQKPASKRR